MTPKRPHDPTSSASWWSRSLLARLRTARRPDHYLDLASLILVTALRETVALW